MSKVWLVEEKEYAKALYEVHGKDWGAIAAAVNGKFGNDRTASAVRSAVTWVPQNERPEAVRDNLLEENKALRQEMTRIIKGQSVMVNDFSGTVIRFGAMSDTHLGSKYENLNLLDAAYDMYEREGIKDVYHSGDLLDGENMYRGQVYELHVHGCDDQIAYAVDRYPQRKGIKTYFIIGNHDGSFWKRSGIDIGLMVAAARPDMIYLGPDEADVELRSKTGKAMLRLHHPHKGTAYSLSYNSQKYIESLTGGHKSNMICFVAGTSVTMGNGMVQNIEDIEVGDVVLTHKGRQRNVTAVGDRTVDRTVEVLAYGIPKQTLISSVEHPYYVMRSGKQMWVEAQHIQKTDWLARPILEHTESVVLDFPSILEKHFYRLVDDILVGTNGKQYKRYIDVDEQFCRLLGLYVAEGYTGKERYRLCLAFNQNEDEYTDFVLNAIKDIFNTDGIVTDRAESNTRVIRFGDMYVADLFASLTSRYASNKSLPAWALTLPKKLQFELIKGLFEGDGCSTKDYYELSTISRNLVEQVMIISARLGLAAGYSAQTRHEKYKKTEYTLRVHRCGNLGDKWFDSVIINQSPYKKLIVNDAGYVWHKVRGVKTADIVDGVRVYNLEVDQDNSYLASSVIVHNCTGHYHKMEMLFYRNVHLLQTGTCQHQTPFMRGRNLAAVQGFWIVELTLNEDGIARCKTEWFPCYD